MHNIHLFGVCEQLFPSSLSGPEAHFVAVFIVMSIHLFVFKQNDNKKKANVMEEEAHSQNSTAAGVTFWGDVTLVDEFKI